MDADPPEKRGRPEWSREATDKCTCSSPSGYWARHVEKVDRVIGGGPLGTRVAASRSQQHTSELQSHLNLVCRLLLEKKKEAKEPPPGVLVLQSHRPLSG